MNFGLSLLFPFFFPLISVKIYMFICVCTYIYASTLMFTYTYLFSWALGGFHIHISKISYIYIYIYIYIYHHHHHHHVGPLARIPLTHFSLSFIASVRSSGLYPVSSLSCCMYVRSGRPAFARPYVGVHRSTSLFFVHMGSRIMDVKVCE